LFYHLVDDSLLNIIDDYTKEGLIWTTTI